MALLEILKFPDSRLAKKSLPVTTFDAKLEKLCADMLETMYDAPGIGLAAPQVNVLKRIVVLDVAYESSEDEPPVLSGQTPQVFINPVILEKNGKILMKEGCLSVPGEYEEVERSQKITLQYQDIKGSTHLLEAEDLLSVAIQHEIDHLEGRLFIDRLSFIKSRSIKKRIIKEQES